MSDHPLRIYARDRSTTLAEIAERAGTSRQTLHRVMRGENATLDVLRRISAATGGIVSVGILAEPPVLDGAENADLAGVGHDIPTAAVSHGAAE